MSQALQCSERNDPPLLLLQKNLFLLWSPFLSKSVITSSHAFYCFRSKKCNPDTWGISVNGQHVRNADPTHELHGTCSVVRSPVHCCAHYEKYASNPSRVAHMAYTHSKMCMCLYWTLNYIFYLPQSVLSIFGFYIHVIHCVSVRENNREFYCVEKNVILYFR